jgi:ComF family protein
MRDFGHGLLDLALPPRCLHCDGDFHASGNIMLCPPCVQSIAPELPMCCPWCGAILPEGMQPSEDCPACKDFKLKFDTVFPLGRYDGPMRDVVLKTKRIPGEALSLALGRLLAERLGERIAEFDPQVVVPIPMHWWRRLLRGTNNPDLLAECLGRALGIPVVRMLARRRYTSPQWNLRPRERFRNVRGAFALRRWRRPSWNGARVLLVDDILTTGATCSEAAGLLKQAGAAAVAVAVIARANESN